VPADPEAPGGSTPGDAAAPAALRIERADAATWTAARDAAVARLDAGDVALLPAEGLYGYHARADRPEALERLRMLKPREAGKGWILLLGEARALDHWDATVPARAIEVAARHWPGPLTIVLPAASTIPPALRAADGTVAVRCPGDPFLKQVVRAAGGLVVSTSANRPGEPPPARLEDAGRIGVALAVDAGPLSGIPSTIGAEPVEPEAPGS
jgi:L-threonylcarbamoyladenylate synthase